MSFHDAQLPIPGEAIVDPKSVEMLRAWIANHALHCSLNIGVWESSPDVDERHAWGIVLADVAKHVADAFATEGKPRDESIALIRRSFLDELDEPTSASAGDFVDGPSRN
jgi:hypothetical protein